MSKTAWTNLESVVLVKGRHEGQILQDSTYTRPLGEARSETERTTEVTTGWGRGERAAVNGRRGEEPSTLQIVPEGTEGRRPCGDSRSPLWPAPSPTSIPKGPLGCRVVQGRQGLPEKGSSWEPASPVRSPRVPGGLSNAERQAEDEKAWRWPSPEVLRAPALAVPSSWTSCPRMPHDLLPKFI